MFRKAGLVLIGLGILIAFIGILFLLLDRAGGTRFWNWFGRLPGDIRIERDGFVFFFPLTSMLLLSLIFNLLIWLIRRLF